MSKARAKGTAGENFFLGRLRRLFYPNLPAENEIAEGVDHPLQRLDMVARHQRANDGDFVGVPWLHEAKNTQKPLFQAWARVCEKKAGFDWVILWKGDLRSPSGNGPYVFMPLEKYEELVSWEKEVRARMRAHVLAGKS